MRPERRRRALLAVIASAALPALSVPAALRAQGSVGQTATAQTTTAQPSSVPTSTAPTPTAPTSNAPTSTAATSTAPADLASLLALLGSQRERRAAFVERRYSALTRAPLESRGRLLFRAPDRLEKQTLSPQRETVRIDGGTVTIEGLPVRGVPERRSLQLADIPLLAALVESLRATLAGDLARLQRHYTPRFRVLERGWELVLAPVDAQLAAAVTRVVLRGRGDAVAMVEILEAGGDRTELSITPVA